MGPLQCRADDDVRRGVDEGEQVAALQWGRSNAERMTLLQIV